jgi:hypothetical protein
MKNITIHTPTNNLEDSLGFYGAKLGHVSR